MSDSLEITRRVTDEIIGGLEDSDRQCISYSTKRIKDAVRKSAMAVIEIGKDLSEIKEILQHGDFDTYVGLHFEFSKTACVRFMAVYEKYGKQANLAYLEKASPSALYALLGMGCSEAIESQAMEQLESGEELTLKMIKDWMAIEMSQKKIGQGDTQSKELTKMDSMVLRILDNADFIVNAGEEQRKKLADNIKKLLVLLKRTGVEI